MRNVPETGRVGGNPGFPPAAPGRRAARASSGFIVVNHCFCASLGAFTGTHGTSSASAARAPTTSATSTSTCRADRLTVLTGLSGSGKSSLAFDTLYAEGQRRYVESLSAYARQFLSMMDKPDVDQHRRPVAGHRHRAEGRLAQPAIDRRHRHRDLRLPAPAVRARGAAPLPRPRHRPRGPDHQPDGRPDAGRRAGGHRGAAARAAGGRPQGRASPSCSPSSPARASCAYASTARSPNWRPPPKLDARRRHTIEAVVDRLRLKADAGQRLAESFETALKLGSGTAAIVFSDDPGARAAGVLEPPRLPAVRLRRADARAAHVLLQQSGRRLPDLRRAGRAGVLRSRPRGRAPPPRRSPAARCAAGTAAMRTISR